MPAIVSIIFKVAALFFSSFVFWRRLRDDYTPGRVFSFTLILFLGAAAGNFLAIYLPLGEEFPFWLLFFLSLLLALYLTKKLDFRLFDVIDSLVPAWLVFLFIYSLALVEKLEGKSLVNIVLALLGLIIFYFFQQRYRSFSFYPSGKVGFPGLATLGVYFLARSAILFSPLAAFPDASPAVYAILSLVLSFFFLFAVYLRSGRPGAEKLIIKWKK